jgi:hypothetical protein
VRDGVLDFSQLPPTAEFNNGDGRVLPGHFDLLRRLRDEGRLVQAIAVDRLDPEPLPHWTVRDREMAERVLDQWDRRQRLLIATGAFHAKLECPDGKTMAMHLAEAVPEVQTVLLRY